MVRAVRPGPPRARDPYGVGPVGSLLAPVLSVVGLVLIGIVTFNLINGDLPFGSGGGNGSGNGDGGPARTPAPSNVVVVPEEATFQGSITYAKGGNIWIQTDNGVKQLTDTGGASMPSWSPDGQWIVYIHSTDEIGYWPVCKGGSCRNGRYDIQVPDLMRVKADGSAKPERLAKGFVKKGKLEWASWMRQPVISPDGTTIALVTDLPNPDESNVVLQFFNVETKKLRRAGVKESGVLGHQDPEWRPDGTLLLYTQNGRDGSRGAPVIMRYDTRQKKARALTAAGYMQPSYSPDGRYLAATRTTALGTDIVILDASTGAQLLRITDDGASWAPSWSPAGDGIAFLHIVGQTVDLRLARLDGSAPAWTVKETIALTEVSGLDAASRPDWFIPADLLPETPPPTARPTAAAPSASASAAP
jgi:dipeptidyl aminopeptidase/acylaminoacyl peptidase